MELGPVMPAFAIKKETLLEQKVSRSVMKVRFLKQVRLSYDEKSFSCFNSRFNIKKFYVVPTLHLCVLYGSQNKQQLLPYKTLRDWFL